MGKHLQRDLSHMREHILAMSALVETAIHQSIHALQDRNVELARQVIDGDAEIDLEENYVEDECLKMLALHQPVAVDLRLIVSVLKINSELERMADLAANIAERALALPESSPLVLSETLQKMTETTTLMVRQSLDAFMRLDAHQARMIIRLDDEVDQFNRNLVAELSTYMRASADHVKPGLSLFSAVRHLERIADHAAAIAEDVVYLVEGEIIRHHPTSLEANGTTNRYR